MANSAPVAFGFSPEDGPLIRTARAIIAKPSLILADEPTANLDFGNQARVLDEIRANGEVSRSPRFELAAKVAAGEIPFTRGIALTADDKALLGEDGE